MNMQKSQLNRSITKSKDYSLKDLRKYGYDIQVVIKDIVEYQAFDSDVEASVMDLIEDKIEKKEVNLNKENSRRFYNLYKDGEIIMKEANAEELVYLVAMEHMLQIGGMGKN